MDCEYRTDLKIDIKDFDKIVVNKNEAGALKKSVQDMAALI